MCLTLSYILECTECAHRQSLGGSVREVCKLAVQRKHCEHHEMDRVERHVCGSCILEKEEDKARMEAAKREEKKKKGNKK